jgi:hypothetical protein
MQLRRMGSVGHVALIGERLEAHTKFWPKNLKERGQFGDLGIDGRIILK